MDDAEKNELIMISLDLRQIAQYLRELAGAQEQTKLGVIERLDENDKPNSISERQKRIISNGIPKLWWHMPRDLNGMSYSEAYALIGKMLARAKELHINIMEGV